MAGRRNERVNQNNNDLNPEPRQERKTFDAVLKQLCETPPLPRVKVKVGKKKLRRVLEG
ncbi:MAG TPA: hypothetical protein VEI52_01865 [Terriglobales bacterium]|nr:hypothetical protein [Terriglobales bacterium]